jgi:hypothetical protein
MTDLGMQSGNPRSKIVNYPFDCFRWWSVLTEEEVCLSRSWKERGRFSNVRFRMKKMNGILVIVSLRTIINSKMSVWESRKRYLCFDVAIYSGATCCVIHFYCVIIGYDPGAFCLPLIISISIKSRETLRYQL